MSFQDMIDPCQLGWPSFAALLAKLPDQLHLRLHSSFCGTVAPSWHFHRANTDLHVMLVRGGRGRYVIGGTEVELKRGTLVFVGAGVMHESFTSLTERVQIIPARFAYYRNDTGSVCPEQPGIAFWLARVDLRKYEPLFERLYLAHTRCEELEKRLAGSLLHQILAELVREQSARFLDPRVQQAKALLEQSPETRWTLEALAKRSRVTPRHFARLFRQETGFSPAAYQIRARVEKACDLLEEGGANIGEIARELNYPDLFTFSRQFRQQMGMPPSAYRKSRGG